MDIFSKYKEKALTPLKIPELLSTPPKNNKQAGAELGQAQLKLRWALL